MPYHTRTATSCRVVSFDNNSAPVTGPEVVLTATGGEYAFTSASPTTGEEGSPSKEGDGAAGRRKSNLHVGSFKGRRPFLAALFFVYNIVGEKRTTPVARHQQESAEESDNFDASRRARTHGDEGKALAPLACVAHAQ